MTPAYIEASAGVRYWEDATINGKDDTDGTLTPLRTGTNWCPVIRLADGVVMDWPTISKPPLNEGETYIDLIGSAEGEAYHLILLPGDNDDATHQDQMDWAKSIGGDLPDRVEQVMLFKHFKAEFQDDWYWSNETHHSESSWAWGQHFTDGLQYDGHKGDELRARAVRRVVITKENP